MRSSDAEQMEAEGERKGAGRRRSGHGGCKEQSPGFKPEPASKRVLTSMCVHARMCWGACSVSRMFRDQLHLCHLFGEEAGAGQAGAVICCTMLPSHPSEPL